MGKDKPFSTVEKTDMGKPAAQFGDITPPRRFSVSPDSPWSPPLEMFTRGEQLIVRVELPGLREEDIELEIDGRILVLRGERKWEHEETTGETFHFERRYGAFRREISLPAGADTHEPVARFEHGVLEVQLKWSSEVSPSGRRIPISTDPKEPSVH